MKARSTTLQKCVFSLNFPSACYVQREFKIVLFTEHLQSPLKDTDTSRKMDGLLDEVCFKKKKGKRASTCMQSFQIFSVITTVSRR